jgi:hypothetical protein
VKRRGSTGDDLATDGGEEVLEHEVNKEDARGHSLATSHVEEGANPWEGAAGEEAGLGKPRGDAGGGRSGGGGRGTRGGGGWRRAAVGEERTGVRRHHPSRSLGRDGHARVRQYATRSRGLESVVGHFSGPLGRIKIG